MKRSGRIRIYRRVRAALLATNRRTDNSIITECNIVRPLVNSRGTDIVPNNVKNGNLVRVRKVTRLRTVFDSKS